MPQQAPKLSRLDRYIRWLQRWAERNAGRKGMLGGIASGMAEELDITGMDTKAHRCGHRYVKDGEWRCTLWKGHGGAHFAPREPIGVRGGTVALVWGIEGDEAAYLAKTLLDLTES